MTIEEAKKAGNRERLLWTAAEEYLARGERRRHPYGKFDREGRWFPKGEERCECCKGIRSPSRAWPYTLMLHCRTARHVAMLAGVPVRDLKAVAKLIAAGEHPPGSKEREEEDAFIASARMARLRRLSA